MEPEICDLNTALKGSTEPLVVVLGAGGSRSSGGPTTDQVHEALSAAITRLGSDDLRARLHEVSTADKVAALVPLFESARPYIGYRCLAALGRTRRVVVLNLNWDGLISTACERLDVPVVQYDVRDSSDWGLATTLPTDSGVLVIHLHGQLSGNPRYGYQETRSFTDDEVDHIRSHVEGHRSVLLGLSLTEDDDVVSLLAGVSDDRPGSAWAFVRDSDSPHAAAAARTVQRFGAKSPVLLQHLSVDFDRIMLSVTDGVIGPPWAVAQLEVPHRALPGLADLVLPEPELVRNGLDAPAVVFLGPPQNGKTTLSCLFGHLARVWRRGSGALRYFDGPPDALAALTAPTHVATDDVLVLDNPFGDDGRPADASTLDRLRRWLETPSAPQVFISSRVAPWTENVPVGVMPEGVHRTKASPANWYRLDELRWYARRLERPGLELERSVGVHGLDTPGRIRDASAGLNVESSTSDQQRLKMAVSERTRVLDADQALGLTCALIRLQEFGGPPVVASAIEQLAGGIASSFASELMIHRYRWEQQTYMRLRHPLDREATDDWLERHLDEVDRSIRSPGAPEGLADGWHAWSVLREVRAGRWANVRAVDADTLAEVGAQILEVARSEDAIDVVASAHCDAWSAADVAYVLVRTWDSQPRDARRKLLTELLTNERCLGAYAVLEACLYLQDSTPREVLIATQNRFHELESVDDATLQIALAIDGLTWRTPSDQRWAVEWVHGVLAHRPELAGVLPVIAAYHRGGAEALGLGGDIAAKSKRSLGPEQLDLMARLVRWHFLHQSRARAQIVRQHWVDKEFLCRTLHPTPAGLDDEGLLWLVSALVDAGQAGWAVHASLFAAGALGMPIGPQVKPLVAAAFGQAPPADVGVVTGVATYPDQAIDLLGTAAVKERFREQAWVDGLLDAAVDGVRVDDTAVSPPRFCFVSGPGTMPETLGVRFGRLNAAGMTADSRRWVATARSELGAAVEQGNAIPAQARKLLHRFEYGDLRTVDDAVAAYGAGDPTMAEVLLRAAQSEANP